MEIFTYPAIYDTAFQFRSAEDTVDFIEECVRMYTHIPVRSILDVACGTGHYTLEFARRGYRIQGVDMNDDICQYARQKATDESLDVDILCADMVDFSLPRPCDLAVNFFDSLTYLTDRRQVSRHFLAVADALVSGGLYVLEIGVIDDFENHNLEEVWTERRRDFAVTATYFRDGAIDPECGTFIERCAFRSTCREHHSYLVLKQKKLALYFYEFAELIDHVGCFTPLVYFDDFASEAFLPEDAR
ncbi:hypothetical protein CSA56_05450, partial [candidate division KSB3 bacterium]